MHTAGPWRWLRREDGAKGDIASISGGETPDTNRATTEANARLIEHASDLESALRALLDWAQATGGWEAPCWRRAETLLARIADGAGGPA